MSESVEYLTQRSDPFYFAVKYLSCAVDVIRIVVLTRSQCDVGDVLHWVGQSQQHLAFLERRDD